MVILFTIKSQQQILENPLLGDWYAKKQKIPLKFTEQIKETLDLQLRTSEKRLFVIVP